MLVLFSISEIYVTVLQKEFVGITKRALFGNAVANVPKTLVSWLQLTKVTFLISAEQKTVKVLR